MTPVRSPTAFEWAVYAIVREIPRGQTRTYRWVAERLGNRGLARAVGNALNRNPCLRGGCQCAVGRRGGRVHARHVPCHRVVRSDGRPGGFSRGAARKVAWLRREGWSPPPAAAVKKPPGHLFAGARQVYLVR